MLIPDLLNTLFDQANYQCLTILKPINKRKTKYANKYSVLRHYSVPNANFNYACENGLIKMIVGFDFACTDINMYFALLRCAKHNNILAVKYLIGLGADIHEYDDLLLIRCVRKWNFDVVKYLVSIGADIHASEDFVLIDSARNGKLEFVKFFVNNGADVNAHNGRALFWSAFNEKTEIVDYFINLGGVDEKLILEIKNLERVFHTQILQT